MSENLGRKLNELRACDLKDELVKRKLNSCGLKNELIERLQNALKDEGKDPEKFLFPLLDKRGSKNVKKVEENESQSNNAKADDAVVSENEKNESLVVDEVGSVDGDEQDFQEQVDASIENVNDNEESINLTIGEDEQKLLHEEEDQDDKEKLKDIVVDNSVKIEKSNEDLDTENKVKTEESKECSKDEKVEATDKNVEKNNESETKITKVSQTKEEKEKTAEAITSENKSNSSSSAAKPHRNLWVSGLTSMTRASDLKSIFSKYGKVIGAKVVTNTRTPGSRCYGYVTMGSSSEVTRCIEHLHGTELHGRIISVERTKNEIGGIKTSNQRKEEEQQRRSSKESKRKLETDTTTKMSDDKAKENKSKKVDKETAGKHQEKEPLKDLKVEGKTPTKDNASDKKVEEKEKGKDNRHRSEKSSSRTSMERKRSRDRKLAEERERERRAKERWEQKNLRYWKNREERDRERLREKDRELREEDRRRREMRRRQHEEEDRLLREREKLAIERERLEREKAELVRLERERQKLEREKIELERLELKRQQMKIMEQNSRIEEKRPIKRITDDRYGEVDRKRSTNDRRFEAPPPPRFDPSLASNSFDRSDKKRDDYVGNNKRDDYTSSKRDDYISSKRDDYSSKRASDIIVPPPPPRHASGYHSSHGNRETASHKTSRYIESEVRPISYRAGRSPDRSDPRTASNKRYDVSSTYSERTNSSAPAISGSAPWHSGNNQTIKSFATSSIPTSGNAGVWQNKSNDDHWGRPMDAQDRYDRTYNERGGYGVENPRSTTMFGGRPDGRYSGQISSRYENGKY